MTSVFKDYECEGVLLADASNAFDTLNREACLQNVQHLCPAIAPIVVNTYRHLAPLFLLGANVFSPANVQRKETHVRLWNNPTSAIDCHGWHKCTPGSFTTHKLGGKLENVRQCWNSLTESRSGPLSHYSVAVHVMAWPQKPPKAKKKCSGTCCLMRCLPTNRLAHCYHCKEYTSVYLISW